ncbi:MAG: quinone oxidoreductase family protein [Bosea sp. (in: a-proteobacteria)]
MVKAIRIHKTGGPEVMVLEDVPAVAPGAGEVLVRNKAIGLNFIDVYFRTGLYPAPAMPFTPGNEGAGDVLAVGPGVKGFKKGDRVAYVSTLGSYAEQRLVPVASLVHLPKDIAYKQAAGMMLKGLTAEYLLFRTYKVKKGDTVLVHAAAGGTGQILCQWANALGATVIGTVGSPEKAKLAKKCGAHHTILYNTEDFAARVKEITGGKLCAVVYDGVGKTTFLKSLDCLRPFGVMATFGNASGAVEPFNPGILGGKGSLYVTRPTLFTHIGDKKTYAAMAKNLFGAVASGKVKVPVKATFALADAGDAHRALEGRGTTGSTVLVP